MPRISDAVTLGVGPTALNFMKRAAAQIKSQKAPEIDIKLNPQLTKLRAEMAAERKRQEAKSIGIGVHLDRKSLRRFDGEIRRIESVYKISDTKRAFRVQIFVAGASALPSLVQGAASATAALTDLLRVSAAIPGVFSGFGAAVGTAALGLRGIGEAFKAAADESKDAAEKMRDYKDAVRDMEKAQRGVVDALKEANRQLEDQRDALKSNEIDVERAALGVAQANQKLAKGGFKTALDYRDAVLDQKEAVLRFNDALKKNQRGIQDYFQAQSQGVTKSDSVLSAVDRLSDSIDKFGKAQQAVNGFSDKFLQALANISPAAQDFVLKIRALAPAWKQVSDAVSTKLFADIGTAISDLALKRLPVLRAGMEKVAQGLNADFKQLLASLGSDQNTAGISKIFSNTAIALQKMKPGIDSLITVFVKISEVGSRFLPRLAEAFNTVLGRFQQFIDKADKDGSLENWIDRGLKAWASLGESVIQVGRIMGAITTAYEKATGNVGGFASTMERGLTRLANYLDSPKGQQGMVKSILEAKEFMQTIKDSLPGIIDIFQALGDAARQFATQIFPVLSGIGKFISNNLTLAKMFLTAVMAWRTVSPIVSGLKKNFDRLRAGMNAYKASVESAIEQERVLGQEIIANREKAMKSQAKAAKARQEAKKAELYMPQWRDAAIASKQRVKDAEAELRLRQQAYEQQERFTRQAEGGVSPRTGRAYSQSYVQGQQTALNNRLLELGNATRQYVIAQEQANEATKQYGKLQKASADNTALAKREIGKASEAMRLADRATQQLSSNGITRLNNTIGEKNGKGLLGRFSLLFEKMSTWATTKSVQVNNGTGRMATAFGNLGNAAAKASGGFGRLSNAIGAGGKSGGGLMGKLGALMGALGGWALGGAVSAVATAGIIFALYKLADAHEKAGERADYQRQKEEELANQLDQTTGSVTRAGINQAIKDAQQSQLTGRGNSTITRDAVADATKPVSQGGLGLNLEQFKLSFDPTQIDAIAAVQKAADQNTIDAIKAGKDPQWNKFGDRLRAKGLSLEDYARAINGDQAMVDKFNKAVGDLNADAGGFSWAIGSMQSIGALPELGSAVTNLINAGVPGVSVGQIQRRNEAANKRGADAAKERGSVKPLKQAGIDTFGISAGLEGEDGESVSFRKDNLSPADVERYKALGVNLTPLSTPGSYTVTITGDQLKEFVQGYYAGGPVWGAGTATSDSIPAMLSNGEYVINAKSAKIIGHDTLDKLNKAPYTAKGGKYAPGGPVDPNDPYSIIKGIGEASAQARQNTANATPIAQLPNAVYGAGAGFRVTNQGLGDYNKRDFGSFGEAQAARRGKTYTPPPAPISPPTLLDVGKNAWKSAQSGIVGMPGPSSQDAADYYNKKAGVDPGILIGGGGIFGETKPFTMESYASGLGMKWSPKPAAPAPAAPKPPAPPAGPASIFPPQTGSGGAAGPGGISSSPGVPGMAVAPAPAGSLPPGFPSYDSLPGPTGVTPSAGMPSASSPTMPSPTGGIMPAVIPQAGMQLPKLSFNEQGAQRNTIRTGRIVQMLFPMLGSNGNGNTWREKDGPNEHFAGEAVDLGLGGDYATPEKRAYAQSAVDWIMQNAGPLNIRYVIWDNKMWYPGQGPVPYNGSQADDSQKHLDHVHIRTTGGGLPGFGEQFTAPQGLIMPAGAGNPAGAGVPIGGTPQYYIPPTAGGVGATDSPTGIDGAIANAIPGINAPLMGPYGEIPFKPLDFGKELGKALLGAVLGFFGIDISPIVDTTNSIIDGIGDMNKSGGGDAAAAIPGVDLTQEPNMIANQLLGMAAEAKAAGNEPLAKQYYNMALQQVQQGQAAQSAYSGSLTAPSANYSGGTPEVHNAVYRAFKEAGYSDDQWPALVELLNHENDTWDPARPTGGPNSDASGIFQFLSTTWGTVGMEPSLDPYIQAVAGMRYIKSRYKDPKGAWAAWQSQRDAYGHNWYSRGGPVKGRGSSTSDSIPAMLSNGEYVLRAAAVRSIGVNRLNAMNKYADGGLVLPWLEQNAPLGPPPGPPPGIIDPNQPPNANADPSMGVGAQTQQPDVPVPDAIAQAGQDIAGGIAAAIPSEGGGVANGGADQQQADPRGILGAAPTSDNYMNPAFSGAIQGAFDAVGSIANTAIQAGAMAGTMGGSAMAGGMGSGQAGQLVQAGTKIAGMVATGAANVLSAAFVGSVTPSQTGQGYGAPLVPAQPQNPVSNFQSIHNGNIVTNNLDEYSRLKDRKDAQRSVPFFNRIG